MLRESLQGSKTLPSTALFLLAAGVAGTIACGPAAVLESLVRRLEPGLARAILATVGVGAVSSVADLFREVALKVVLAREIFSPGTTTWQAASYARVELPSGERDLCEALARVTPFVLLALARLRPLGLLLQSVVVGFGSAALVLWLLRCDLDHSARNDEIRAAVRAALFGGLLLPLAAALADAFESRLVARIVREPPGAPPRTITGLPRSRRPFVLAVLTVLGVAGGLSASLSRVVPDPPPPRSPTAAERAEQSAYEAWLHLLANRLPAARRRDLDPGVTVRHFVRAEIGDEDPLCVETRLDLALPWDRVGHVEEILVTIDGQATSGPSEARRDRSTTGYSWAGGRTLVVRDLSPGKHEVALVTSLSLYVYSSPATRLPVEHVRTDGEAVVWSGTLRTRHEVRVVPGSVRSRLWRVTPAEFKAADSELVHKADDMWVYLWMPTSPVAVRAQAVLTEGERTLGSTRVVCEPGERAWAGVWLGESGLVSGRRIADWKLLPGRHRLALTVLTDTDVALEEDGSTEEILDTGFRKEIDVDVPK